MICLAVAGFCYRTSTYTILSILQKILLKDCLVKRKARAPKTAKHKLKREGDQESKRRGGLIWMGAKKQHLYESYIKHNCVLYTYGI